MLYEYFPKCQVARCSFIFPSQHLSTRLIVSLYKKLDIARLTEIPGSLFGSLVFQKPQWISKEFSLTVSVHGKLP